MPKTKTVISIFTLVFLLLFSAGNCLAADTLLESGDMNYLGAFTIPDVGTGGAASAYSQGTTVFNPSGNGGAGSLFITGFNTIGYYVGEISIPGSLYTGTDYANYSSSGGINDSSHVATFLQGLNPTYYWDITEGHSTELGIGQNCPSSSSLGIDGMWLNGNTLVSTMSNNYDNSECAVLTLFTHTTSPLSATGSFQGMYGLNPGTDMGGAFQGGLMAGALGAIPAAYQSQLGGKVLVSGNGPARSIIGNSSIGPTLTSFDPANLGTPGTVSSSSNAHFLVGYPQNHQTLGEWSSLIDNIWVGKTDHYAGVVFPVNSRTVLIFGTHGEGAPGTTCPGSLCPGQGSEPGCTGTPTSGVSAYGYGTTDCSQLCYRDGVNLPACPASGSYTCGDVTVTDNGPCLYDPTAPGQNGHAPRSWPYVHYAWAYDVGNPDGTNSSGNAPSASWCLASGQPWAGCTGKGTGNISSTLKNNLTAVKLGLVNPWDIVPYATWILPQRFHGTTPDNFHGSFTGASYDPASGKIYLTVYQGQPYGTPVGTVPVIEVYQVNYGSDTTPPAAPGGLSVY